MNTLDLKLLKKNNILNTNSNLKIWNNILCKKKFTFFIKISKFILLLSQPYLDLWLFKNLLILRKSPEKNQTSPVTSTIDDNQPSNTIIASIGLTPFAMQIILSIASIGCCVAMSLPLAHLVAHMSDIGYGAAHGAQLISLMLMAAGVSSFFGVGYLGDKFGTVYTRIYWGT